MQDVLIGVLTVICYLLICVQGFRVLERTARTVLLVFTCAFGVVALYICINNMFSTCSIRVSVMVICKLVSAVHLLLADLCARFQSVGAYS